VSGYDICSAVYLFSFFFFSSRRRHTRLQGDWSSDVCSSDLRALSEAKEALKDGSVDNLRKAKETLMTASHKLAETIYKEAASKEIGRASCRERVEISVVAV